MTYLAEASEDGLCGLVDAVLDLIQRRLHTQRHKTKRGGENRKQGVIGVGRGGFERQRSGDDVSAYSGVWHSLLIGPVS
jgi:hypothetical protein